MNPNYSLDEIKATKQGSNDEHVNRGVIMSVSFRSRPVMILGLDCWKKVRYSGHASTYDASSEASCREVLR